MFMGLLVTDILSDTNTISCPLGAIITWYGEPSALDFSGMRPRRILRRVTRHLLRAPQFTSTLHPPCSIEILSGWFIMS
jgi:hypothetical protein